MNWFFMMIGAVTAASAPAPTADQATEAAIARHAFKGAVLIARDQRNVHAADDRDWPWASVTKQIVAILVMQQVEAGRIALDVPASRYLSALRPDVTAPTIRQLLQHRSGLRNPEDASAFYTASDDPVRWCLKGRGPATEGWRYNNCDYHVLGALLERVTGKRVSRLFAERIAQPLKLRRARFLTVEERVGQFAMPPTRNEQRLLARYGAAGGLVGPSSDLLAIDRALVDGRLLGAQARGELWRADGKLGYMALGQWSFSAPLAGCSAPVALIERRGAIGRYQARNVIAPDRKAFAIFFTADADYDFGEIWQGKGPSHDLLAAGFCTP